MQTILEKYKNNDNYKVLLSKLVAVENQKFIRYLREKETDELLLITEDLIKSTKKLKAKKIADTIEFLKRKLIRYRNLIIYKNINQYIPKEYGDKTKLLEYQKSRVTGPEPCMCHAPSRSLYIDMQGKFTACCFNRVYVFGRYPENNLQDIISGEKENPSKRALSQQFYVWLSALSSFN
jgi:MoaA/NifB/PqqE/SkfB family radical SAM enzyme